MDIQIAKALVLTKGDNVLVSVQDELEYQQSVDMLDSLRDRFPDVNFTLVSGVSGLAVL